MRIGLGQFDSVVGELSGNAERMRRIYLQAKKQGVDLLLFPELSICGYPPEDLLIKKHFLQDCSKTVEQLAADCPDTTIITGLAGMQRGKTCNCAAVLHEGHVAEVYVKGLLPNYGVFDEQRYFSPGNEPLVIDVCQAKVAVTICRDMWDIEWLESFLKESGTIDVIVNISASPFYLGKIELRKKIVGQCAEQFECVVCYCNLVGGQDELVFDGRSMIADPSGKIVAMARAFEEDLLVADISLENGKRAVGPLGALDLPEIGQLDEIYAALVLGTKDYVRKNNFEKVLIGLSGGIDSCVTAAIAVAALGADNVIGITMPSQFNSQETISDAGRLAESLGIEFLTIPIGSVLEQFSGTLDKVSGWDNKGIAYENLQARIRGTILMTLSNQLNALVLTTGNKSEIAVGYTTLYGDTAGGFAVIKDVFKTMVYKLAAYINKISEREVIPPEVIDRPPSAELRADQKDTDSLPEYELLDEILKGYVEEDKSAMQLIEQGLPKDIVIRVIRMVDRNEYKRRQSPPGVKITPKAFGRDRRLPITNLYNPWAD